MRKKWKPMLLAGACLFALPASAGEVIAQFEGYVGKTASASTYSNPLRIRGPASICAQPKRPTNVSRENISSTYFGVQKLTTGSEAQCVRVDMKVLDGCGNGNPEWDPDNPGQLTLVAYADLPDVIPRNFDSRQNYLADMGIVLTDPAHANVGPSSASMSFVAPANSTISFLVTDRLGASTGAGTKCHYKLTVSAVDGPAEPTAVPTLGQWTMLGLAGLLSLMGVAAIRRRG
jgi:hypothetical protein